MGERLGVLGGTFDPLHIGHAVVAQDVLERLELDRLLVIPAARPPHRRPVLPADLRFALVSDVFAGAPGLEVSDLELRRPGPSYTVDTLVQVRELHDPSVLYCVIGSDQLRTLRTWHRYGRLVELAELAVMQRGNSEAGAAVERAVLPVESAQRGAPTERSGAATPAREHGAAGRAEKVDDELRHTTVEVTRVDISGTRIRERLRRGRSVRFLVPECIRERVEEAWSAHGRGG